MIQATHQETHRKPAETSAAITNAEKLAYSGRELQVLLGCSHVTLWRLEKRGLLKPVAGIRTKLYSRKSVENFLDGKAA